MNYIPVTFPSWVCLQIDIWWLMFASKISFKSWVPSILETFKVWLIRCAVTQRCSDSIQDFTCSFSLSQFAGLVAVLTMEYSMASSSEQTSNWTMWSPPQAKIAMRSLRVYPLSRQSLSGMPSVFFIELFWIYGANFKLPVLVLLVGRAKLVPGS